MHFKYTVRVGSDGVNRIGRECIPVSEFKDRLNERRNIVDRRYKTPCWEWTGSHNKRGYGSVMFQGKTVRVNRLSWTLYHGPIPDGMEVCHHCDNPPCFNPDHLFLGTHQQNMRDAFKKGRVPPRLGEQHGCSKLTARQVIEIRKRYKPHSDSRHVLAKEFGVSDDAIYLIATRKTWKHL